MLANLEVPEQVRPIGVTAIAMLFFLSATYIAALGGIMLLAPGTVSMMLGAPLLFGLELAGPYMFLLLAAAGALIGWGLFRLSNLARRAAARHGFGHAGQLCDEDVRRLGRAAP